MEVDPSKPTVAAQLYSLQKEAYALEAQLISCSDFPPLRETREHLQESLDRFLVAIFDSRTFVGALSFTESDDNVTITRLMVSPQYHRRGIASTLLSELEKTVPYEKPILVSTAQANLPAVRLYERHGFIRISGLSSPEGISLVHFRRNRVL